MVSLAESTLRRDFLAKLGFATVAVLGVQLLNSKAVRAQCYPEPAGCSGAGGCCCCSCDPGSDCCWHICINHNLYKCCDKWECSAYQCDYCQCRIWIGTC